MFSKRSFRKLCILTVLTMSALASVLSATPAKATPPLTCDQQCQQEYLACLASGESQIECMRKRAVCARTCP